ncbi:hypothetical protein GCM10028785_37100 [Hydrogenophaga soli]
MGVPFVVRGAVHGVTVPILTPPADRENPDKGNPGDLTDINPRKMVAFPQCPSLSHTSFAP